MSGDVASADRRTATPRQPRPAAPTERGWIRSPCGNASSWATISRGFTRTAHRLGSCTFAARARGARVPGERGRAPRAGEPQGREPGLAEPGAAGAALAGAGEHGPGATGGLRTTRAHPGHGRRPRDGVCRPRPGSPVRGLSDPAAWRPGRRAVRGREGDRQPRGARVVHDAHGDGQRAQAVEAWRVRLVRTHQDTVGIIGARPGSAAPDCPRCRSAATRSGGEHIARLALIHPRLTHTSV